MVTTEVATEIVNRIPVAQIVDDNSTQLRKYNLAVVNEYAEAMEDGAQFPPVVVFQEAERYWLADGFHRLAATKQLGLLEIEAEVQQGTKRDALLRAVGANAEHGLRRTNEDKRRAVETLLADKEWALWNNCELARHCAVSESFIRKVKGELESHNASSPTTDREGIPDSHNASSAEGRNVNSGEVAGSLSDQSVSATATSGQNPATPASSETGIAPEAAKTGSGITAIPKSVPETQETADDMLPVPLNNIGEAARLLADALEQPQLVELVDALQDYLEEDEEMQETESPSTDNPDPENLISDGQKILGLTICRKKDGKEYHATKGGHEVYLCMTSNSMTISDAKTKILKKYPALAQATDK